MNFEFRIALEIWFYGLPLVFLNSVLIMQMLQKLQNKSITFKCRISLWNVVKMKIYQKEHPYLYKYLSEDTEAEINKALKRVESGEFNLRELGHYSFFPISSPSEIQEEWKHELVNAIYFNSKDLLMAAEDTAKFWNDYLEGTVEITIEEQKSSPSSRRRANELEQARKGWGG